MVWKAAESFVVQRYACKQSIKDDNIFQRVAYLLMVEKNCEKSSILAAILKLEMRTEGLEEKNGTLLFWIQRGPNYESKPIKSILARISSGKTQQTVLYTDARYVGSITIFVKFDIYKLLIISLYWLHHHLIIYYIGGTVESIFKNEKD